MGEAGRGFRRHRSMIARCLRLLVSAGVFAGDRLRAGLARLAGRTRPGSCVVINYHVVADEVKG